MSRTGLDHLVKEPVGDVNSFTKAILRVITRVTYLSVEAVLVTLNSKELVSSEGGINKVLFIGNDNRVGVKLTGPSIGTVVY